MAYPKSSLLWEEHPTIWHGTMVRAPDYLGLGLGLGGSPELGMPAARRTLSQAGEGAIRSYSPSSAGISP